MKSKKNLFTAVLCVVMATVTLVTSLQAAATAVSEAVEPELSPYIIEFSDGEAAEEFEINANEDFQAQSLDETIVSAQLTETYAQKLENSEEVCLVEEDIVVCANEDETESEAQEIAESVTWSTKALCAQDLPETGEGVKVAVLDSGLDVYSEVTAYHYVDLVDPEYCGGDDLTGHGTAVAGVISAPKDDSGLVGIAPDAELYVVRILDDSNKAPISRVISGIDWCIANEVDIINMSFGTLNYSQILEAKISEAAQAGILMIAAAGNKGAVEYPAKFTEVAAVGAVTSAITKAGFSATGEELEFVAPGVNVFSTSLIGGYCALSGTSLSAPHIAGAAAVLLGKDTTKSADFIRALLAASCKNLGPASSYGNGIPDLAYALQIYDEFALNYTDGSYQPPVNTGTPETFVGEDVYVVNLWQNEEHGYLMDSYYKLTKLNIRFPSLAKRVSNSTDKKDYLSKKAYYSGYTDSIWFHGTGNYIVMAKLLYEIAVNYKTKGVSNFTHDANTDYSEKAYDFSKCYRYEDFAPLLGGNSNYKKIMINISDMLTYYDADNVSYSNGEEATGFVSVSEKTSTIVFGMFFHLIGDIYAHRAVVPPSSIVNETATSKGSGVGGNQGLYFIVDDFRKDCGNHIAPPQITEIITTEEYYITLLDVIKAFLTAFSSKDIRNFSVAFKYLWYFINEKPIVTENVTTRQTYAKQRALDIDLLENAFKIPTINRDEKNEVKKMVLCYGSMKRIAQLGVLQFKDIKYFLNNSNAQVYSNNQKYYEDSHKSNMFYLRRLLAAEVATKSYCADFYNSVKGGTTVPFKPIQLLPTSTEAGTNIKHFRLKLDLYYNYLKQFDDICPAELKSNVLKKSYWDSVDDCLFNYTTIWDNSNYFVDPATYTAEDRANMIYSKSVFPINSQHKSAEEFYTDV